jgi:hypothetical protein
MTEWSLALVLFLQVCAEHDLPLDVDGVMRLVHVCLPQNGSSDSYGFLSHGGVFFYHFCRSFPGRVAKCLTSLAGGCVAMVLFFRSAYHLLEARIRSLLKS